MKVEWRPRALEDRERIFDLIEQEDPQAAIHQDVQFRDKCLGLVDFPYLYGRGRAKGTREMEIGQSYIVVYRVDTLKSLIEIVRIKGARQKRPQRY